MTSRAASRPKAGSPPSLLALLVLLAGTLPAPLVAQSVAPASPAQSDPAAAKTEKPAEEQPIGVTLKEDVTVTARRREENVQEVPVAVTLKSGRELAENAASDISELQADVPNLSIYAARNQSTTLTAFIRGVGQADPLWGVDPGVGLYLDDVYVARPQGALLDVFDVQRVEVLRGPQGTLYGKNTIGGAIKYVSRDITDRLSGGLSYTGGSYWNHEIKASVGGPLVEGKLRGRAAGVYLRHDGYGTNLLTGREVSNKKTFAYRLS